MINIYIATSVKSLKRLNGSACIVLENLENKGNAVTIFGKILEKTKNGAELTTFKNALLRIVNREELTVYTDNPYLSSAFEQGWLKKWQENGWKTAKGTEVENKADWEEVLKLLNGSRPTFKVKEPHEYKMWMEKELEKRGKQ